MSEPVAWSPEGTPRSSRFDDIYRSASGGLAQARHVFLGGCGLPQAWAGQRCWRILETGFGLGLNFLAAWRAWKDDAQRPGLLHFVSAEAFPVAAADLVRSAQAHPELQELAADLAAQWWGLVPGVHRLSFDSGRVLLTLCIGDARAMLSEQAFAADAVFLDGFDPARNPQMWELPLFKAVARLCRRGTAIATWTVAGQVRRDLQQCGFEVDRVPGLSPKRECLAGRFAPAWASRGDPVATPLTPGRAIVIGAGLAGSAAAASLAQRSWQVQVLDAAAQPATGASGLPAGLLAPHTSSDDSLLSRLSRAGVRMTLQQATRHLRAGTDWDFTGVLERRAPDARAPADLGDEGRAWQEPRADGVWHSAGGWIKPAALVQAWLSTPGVQFRGSVRIERMQRTGIHWQALDVRGQLVAEADLVVVAAALGSGTLLPDLALMPVRGQVSWATRDDTTSMPSGPVNGNGHFLPSVPLAEGPAWLTGSTYGRGDTSLEPRDADQLANLDRLRTLAPEVAAALAPAFVDRAVQAWCGVRCASSDRRPLVGELAPGLWVSTAMGSRGLTFAWLAAELLAARLHGEPLPLPMRLASALDVARQRAAG
ncbi:tRNA (5-methylaminomethyl-2-thiouridine)(34)-methyltransferase MnmD [Ramlibacter sp. MMS24-I3-19]|uniref:tRNA (5-methylaminomethyl-2-thiouridine)(34)-methyltransferase MnmD n=1 Tax=Ramlibacter sp. MMS24-I3-19 TaxID=3416606 RepID=UPI003CFE6643